MRLTSADIKTPQSQSTTLWLIDRKKSSLGSTNSSRARSHEYRRSVAQRQLSLPQGHLRSNPLPQPWARRESSHLFWAICSWIVMHLDLQNLPWEWKNSRDLFCDSNTIPKRDFLTPKSSSRAIAQSATWKVLSRQLRKHCWTSPYPTSSGFQGFIIEKSALKSLQGKENLQIYRFGTGTAQHMFCKSCGISPLTVPRSFPEGYNINYRCLQRDNVRSINVTPRDGQNWEQEMAKGNVGRPWTSVWRGFGSIAGYWPCFGTIWRGRESRWSARSSCERILIWSFSAL